MCCIFALFFRGKYTISKSVEAHLVFQSHMGKRIAHCVYVWLINPLTPNDTYRGRTESLTSKVAFYIFIQQI
jgi:hypothetical protein